MIICVKVLRVGVLQTLWRGRKECVYPIMEHTESPGSRLLTSEQVHPEIDAGFFALT